MTTRTEKDIGQVEAARKVMDQYTTALEALAGKDDAAEERLRRQLETARKRMRKYQSVLSRTG
jgi:hypothetical protein